MTDLESLISIDAVSLGVVADDWRAAVRAAGALLVDAGVTAPEYTDAMIATVETHGPYIVLTQGVGKVGGGWSDVRGCRRVGAGAARPRR